MKGDRKMYLALQYIASSIRMLANTKVSRVEKGLGQKIKLIRTAQMFNKQFCQDKKLVWKESKRMAEKEKKAYAKKKYREALQKARAKLRAK